MIAPSPRAVSHHSLRTNYKSLALLDLITTARDKS